MNFEHVKKQHSLIEQDVVHASKLKWERVHKDWWYRYGYGSPVLVHDDGTVFYGELDWGTTDESVPILSNEVLEELLGGY